MAAQELHLSAPAVTHALNNLEATLGETLCIRNRAAFQLTAAGVRLYQTTQRIFGELEEFASYQKDESQFDGVLSIGILDHFENSRFESALEKVVQKYPLLKLNVQSYDSDTINKCLLDGEISIGLGIFSQRSPRLKYVKIGDEVLKYYISSKHPLWKKKRIHKEDLFGQKTTWLDNQNRKLSELESNIFVENLKYKMQFYGFSNNLSGALQILLSGHAVVPLPEQYGDTISKQYKIRKIEVETKTKSLDQVFVYRPGRKESPASRFLIEQLVSSR